MPETTMMSLKPQETVYSYLLFMVPLENHKQQRSGVKGFNWGGCIAYTIVIVSVFLQTILLSSIFNSIVLGDIDWRSSVYQEFEGCNPGGSLCTLNNGTFSCAPPSVQIATRWEELDLDGDGVWTREEVQKNAEKLQCKYAVNPVEVYDVFVKMVTAREKILWIHPDVKAGKILPKPYFTFAAGDVILCGYRDIDMCPNLLRRGMWDGPLKYGTAPRVGTTIDSALEYCYNLLKPGGACEKTLPSTYAVWRRSSQTQCLAPSYEKMVYKHPKTGRTKSMLAVDYEARMSYKRVEKERLFLIYKACVIGIFLLAVLFDLKDICRFATFVRKFPKASQVEEPIEEEHGDDEDKEAVTKYYIRGIADSHRTIMGMIVLVRICMWCALVIIGLLFMLKTMAVLDLILNGLGVLFIVDICGIIYAQMLNESKRDEHADEVEALEVPMMGWVPALDKNPAKKDAVWFVVLVVWLVTCMATYKALITDPTTEALTCTCLSRGKNCREAQILDKDFWKQYWNVDVPAVFGAVKKMKKEHGGGSFIEAPVASSMMLEGMPTHPAHLGFEF
jgi:hypothetical protein